jgi:hypothetical protein
MADEKKTTLTFTGWIPPNIATYTDIDEVMWVDDGSLYEDGDTCDTCGRDLYDLSLGTDMYTGGFNPSGGRWKLCRGCVTLVSVLDIDDMPPDEIAFAPPDDE